MLVARGVSSKNSSDLPDKSGYFAKKKKKKKKKSQQKTTTTTTKNQQNKNKHKNLDDISRRT